MVLSRLSTEWTLSKTPLCQKTTPCFSSQRRSGRSFQRICQKDYDISPVGLARDHQEKQQQHQGSHQNPTGNQQPRTPRQAPETLRILTCAVPSEHAAGHHNGRKSVKPGDFFGKEVSAKESKTPNQRRSRGKIQKNVNKMKMQELHCDWTSSTRCRQKGDFENWKPPQGRKQKAKTSSWSEAAYPDLGMLSRPESCKKPILIETLRAHTHTQKEVRFSQSSRSVLSVFLVGVVGPWSLRARRLAKRQRA